ncbi:MAG: hypothetical protein BJ554DRAFT_1756, partial [Olpidium bornovanus]
FFFFFFFFPSEGAILAFAADYHRTHSYTHAHTTRTHTHAHSACGCRPTVCEREKEARRELRSASSQENMLRDATSRARRRQQQQPRRRPSAATGGIRQPNLAYTALAAVLALATAAAAIGPPTNSLRLFTMYEIAWVDPQTGQFGANMTFFRSTAASPAPGWGTLLTFRNKKIAVENFWDTEQFDAA